MSFHVITQAPARLNRSELAVPGSAPDVREGRRVGRGRDLPGPGGCRRPDDKAQARKNIIKALNEIDWGKKTMSVRINGLDTHYMYRDVVDVVEQAGERLDLIMIPKVGTAADVYAVDMMVTQIEDAKGLKKRIGFEHIIETALGMQNVTEIAGASKRNESLHFGVADYAASTRARTTIIGGVNPDYSVLTDKLEDGSAVHWGRYVALCAGPDGGGGAGERPAARSTGRSVISRTPTATARQPSARRFWAARANGRSIPARSRWPTR
jgi:malyl-CoA/(S)-citramalyl-CoA lyase